MRPEPVTNFLHPAGCFIEAPCQTISIDQLKAACFEESFGVLGLSLWRLPFKVSVVLQWPPDLKVFDELNCRLSFRSKSAKN